jgi:hypothetical protein
MRSSRERCRGPQDGDPDMALRRLLEDVLFVIAIVSLAGCSTVSPPIVDMQGVDPVRYNRDLAECTDRINSAPISFGNGVSRCMEDKGYRILVRN